MDWDVVEVVAVVVMVDVPIVLTECVLDVVKLVVV
jgi:hypothetical protein